MLVDAAFKVTPESGDGWLNLPKQLLKDWEHTLLPKESDESKGDDGQKSLMSLRGPRQSTMLA